MKKFSFSLETVLAYKQQALDSLQTEHAVILKRVHDQEDYLESLWGKYRDYSARYNQRCSEGMPVTEALACQANLRSRERELKQETLRLEKLRAQEEAKREEVVEAKKETSSIEKLKEKKLNAYHAEEVKQEERLVEEFVMSMRSNAQADAAAP